MRYWAVVFACVAANAEVPPETLIRPVAVCDETSCVMKVEDFKTLQQFHASRMQAIAEANEMIEQAARDVASMRAMLARHAALCWTRT